MAILHSKEEEEFLSRLIFVKFKDSSPWLGGTQVAPGSPDYKWIDGSPFDYHNWQEPDEPDCGSSCCGIQLDYYEVDNIVDTNEKGSQPQQQSSHLLLFNKTIKTFWRDVNCNKELKRVCQIQLTHGPPSQDVERTGDSNSLEESISTENEVDQEMLKFQELTSYDLVTLINMTRILDKKVTMSMKKLALLSTSIENTQRSIIDSEINTSKNFYSVRAAHEEFRQLLSIFTRDDYYFRINWTTLLNQQSVDIKNLVDKSQMVSGCRKPFDPMNVGQTVETLPSSPSPGSLSSSNFPLESLLVANSSEAGPNENEHVITLRGLKQDLDHVSNVITNETKRLVEKIDNLSRGQRNISLKLSELESLQKYYSLPTIMLVITLIMTCASLSLILSIYLNMSAFKKIVGKCCSTCPGNRQDFEMVPRLDSNSNYKNR